MTDFILLENGHYYYMHHYNQFINAEIYERFKVNGGKRKINLKDIEIDEKYIQERLKTLPQLIFEATENCNLRCKYCVYGGSYINQRSFSPKNLSFETAEKGLKQVFHWIKDRKKKKFYISFYGGEPLLNFDIVKQIIQYSKKLFEGWELFFNMTTNLTLLTREILEYIVHSKVSLTVSLDGDKENHDAKRVMASGKGTHDIIMKNLSRIKKYDSEYFSQMMSISAVHSYDLSLKEIHRFFNEDPTVNHMGIQFNGVNTYNTDYYETYPFNEERFRKDLRDIFSQLKEKLKKNEKLSGYESFLINNLKGLKDRFKGRSFDTMGGTCIFDSRLYLDVHGRFHVCEKMNNTLPFGDVDRGFDFPRMAEMSREFQNIIKSYCADCNIRFLCSRCFVTFAGNGRFQLDEKFCSDQKKSMIHNMERYIQYKEEKLI